MTGRKYKNMITSTYDWKINTKELDAGFFKLAKERGLAETAAKIAYERGITPLLTESLFIFSSYGYLDVSVPHVRLPFGMAGLHFFN